MYYLPPELWLYVFEIASHVPEELDSDFQDPFVDPTSTSVLRLMDPKKSTPPLIKAVSRRRGLTLVCRAWCRLATPLLYRTIVIVQWVQVPKLSRTLSKSYGSEVSQDTPALGHWTRRLDLLTSDPEITVDLEELAPIIASTPHLVILHLSPLRVCMRPPTKLFHALRDSCNTSLQKLTWPLWPGIPCMRDDYSDMINACQPLRTLCYGPWRRTDACTFSTPSLPELRFLSIAENCDSHSPAESHLFPSLTQVFLLYSRQLDASCLRSFLQVHSATLTTAYVNVSGYHRGGYFAFEGLKVCTNLVHLVIFMPITNARDRSLFWEGGLPSVSHLGICCTTSGLLLDKVFPELFGVLAEAMYPQSLKVFRIMNEIGTAAASDAFATCHRKLLSLGVEMEDMRGNKFVPPSEPVSAPTVSRKSTWFSR
ncbi:hypothetical protein OF83DRAFT_1101521 [Amylostereum chailletii]|nr:hypothetical protein OF83DRAFT_1101521 [Amylostereum chailletii]